MATQEDVLASLEAAGKQGLVAALNAINASGGAIDMELQLLAPQLGALGPEILALVTPTIHQVLASVISKIK